MSIGMRCLALGLKAVFRPQRMTPADAERSVRRGSGKNGPPPPDWATRYRLRRTAVGEVERWTVEPRDVDVHAAVVWVHGGAFLSGIGGPHWKLISQLVDRGVRVEVPLYGLIPKRSWHGAHDLVLAAYRDAVDALGAERTSLGGDSAGGGLALAVAQQLATAGLPQPRRIALVAPWVELTMSNPEIAAVDEPWSSPHLLVAAGKAWAGDTDREDPRLSPVNGNFDGLAPMSIWIGTRDLLLPDVALLADRARAAGCSVDVTVRSGAVHVYPFFPVREGRRDRALLLAQLSGEPAPSARRTS